MKLLYLDLSTASSGYSVWEDRKLTDYGFRAPKLKGISKLRYPVSSLRHVIAMAEAVKLLISEVQPDIIYVEEVNRGTNRIAQKSLDALHFFVLHDLDLIQATGKLRYIDSDGETGWRTILKLRFTPAQKAENKKRKKGDKLSKKHQACDYVNALLGTTFDVDKNKHDNDVVDAIGGGYAVHVAGLLDFVP